MRRGNNMTDIIREYNRYTLDNLEDVVGGIKTIDLAHHEIHEGHAFLASYTVTTAATDAHRSGLYLKTPAAASGYCHAIISFACSTAATYRICEAPTIAANVGTHTPVPYNRFRNSTVASGITNNATSPAANKFTTLTEAQIAGDGTWATGTVLQSAPLRVGDSTKPAGGVARDTEEWILKADTAYVFLITNTAAGANAHYIEVDWYEE
jgi:hypothetical protein